ncbi:MAG: ABC transporter ATP-binding protein [Gallionella sp.]|jgi:spermidine/putrescine transport system ATP-binding protein
MSQLELRNITRRYGNFVAVNNVSLRIEEGEFFTLLGPSGCGKTTLLRLIAGFELPDEGQILLDGHDLAGIPAEKRPVHTVFQSYALFPHMTVEQNIAFPLKMARCAKDELDRRLAEALIQMRLADKADKYPHELSGGQKQRVALARALINRPRVLLLDESLAALDAKLREEVQVELINLQREMKITFVFVTHAQAEALALSHRIAVMNQGRFEQVDEPASLYGFPDNRFVADFVGHINQMAAQVIEATHGHTRLDLTGLGEIIAPPDKNASAGMQGVFAIRPEQVRMATELVELKNHFSGIVQSRLYQGDVSVYRVGLESGAVLEVLLPNTGHEYHAGEAVRVGWRHDAGLFLNE